MPRVTLSLPADVQAKLAQYAAVYQCDPDAVVCCLAAEAVVYLVRHSKIRQFPDPLLGRGVEV